MTPDADGAGMVMLKFVPAGAVTQTSLLRERFRAWDDAQWMRVWGHEIKKRALIRSQEIALTPLALGNGFDSVHREGSLIRRIGRSVAGWWLVLNGGQRAC